MIFTVRNLKKVLNTYFSDLNLSDTLTHVIVPCSKLSPNQSYIFDSQEAQKSLSYDFQMQDVIQASCADGYYFPVVTIEDIAHNKKANYRSFIPPYNPIEDVYTQLLRKRKKKDIRLLSLGASYFAESDFEKELWFRKIHEN